MKARAIRIEKQGGSELMQLVEIELAPPGPGEALVHQTACGVNFLDVYQRSGAYPMPVPMAVGNEAAGVVEAVGPGVSEIKPGDRVAYQGGAPGAYADLRVVPAWRLVKLPDNVSDEAAPALMLKGMTVECLMERCAPLKPGDNALMYAAAGGVGLIAGQWARARGFNLIGVAGGPEKCAKATAAGYVEVIDRFREDIVARVKKITGGKGVPVAYDSVGRATFETTIECLAPRGMFVSFGASSGPPQQLKLLCCRKRARSTFTRPTLATYTADPADYMASAKKVLDVAATGALKAEIGRRYSLAEAAQAHRDLEAGRTTGSTVLIS